MFQKFAEWMAIYSICAVVAILIIVLWIFATWHLGDDDTWSRILQDYR